MGQKDQITKTDQNGQINKAGSKPKTSFKDRLKAAASKNRFLSGLWYTGRRRHNSRGLRRFGKLPVEPGTVLFNNFYGRGYACNPRVIAERLHQLAPEAKLRWICKSDADAATLPDFIEPVSFGGSDYYKALSTSSVWVFNELLHDGLEKRKDQFYVQTYHGERGFKKVGYDAMDNEAYKKKTAKRQICEEGNCDLFLAGSQYAVRFIRSAFRYTGEILTDGTPRDDCLFDPDPARVAEVRSKLGLEEGVKVLMYAPTFRDTATVEGQVGSDIDLNDVLRVLGEKTGEKWVCLMRAHGGRALTLTSAAETTGFIDVTRYPDMADLLLVTDLLITDYSSAGGDFAITGRPVLLYQDDIENYTNKDRSMYFKMEDSPYWVAHNREEAVELINGITPEAARENDEAILKFYETTETGHATESVCRRIMDFWG